ncbi:Tex family protein [Deferribacterales bacterium RsTz2092]|nr:RNA-binding transcriptional accessory protein [Deferribacterales bacterium]
MLNKLTNEFSFNPRHIAALIALYMDGNTIPFIARYRKEQTGAMNEIDIRAVIDRYTYLTELEKRKNEVLRLIDTKGKLTDELKQAILNADTLTIIEELYAPFKSRRKTKGLIAREAGLEPLADYICTNVKLSTLDDEARKYINELVPDTDVAVSMARDIITERISLNIELRHIISKLFQEQAVLSSTHTGITSERTAYEDYYNFSERISTIPPHRTMAIFRGEREGILSVSVDINENDCIAKASTSAFVSMAVNTHTERCLKRAVKVHLLPSITSEVRSNLKAAGEERAIAIFADNLKHLLMTPPVKDKTMLGLDPAFRTGCKFAVVSKTGQLLDYGVIYPTAPHKDYEGSKAKLAEMLIKYGVNGIAIGNGTASRETEEFVAKALADEKLNAAYTIVSEAGASVYSASEAAIREFPNLDLTIRGAISIARRVIDPLAELVKIEPRAIGVGMYQHDVNSNKLEKALTGVVEDVVNNVGVDVNTASSELLSYVSGLNSGVAEAIVNHRTASGGFTDRQQLKDVAGIGEVVFKQCAGFLKVYGGNEPLDALFIHPESYDAVKKLLEKQSLSELHKYDIKKDPLNIGAWTFSDIVDSLKKPNRDVRDSLEPVVFKRDVLELDSLKEGMRLEGRVTNVVDFGAFVDIGLKSDGLVHISELSDSFVKNPKDVVSVGNHVKVRVLGIDKERGRVSLSMKTFQK